MLSLEQQLSLRQFADRVAMMKDEATVKAAIVELYGDMLRMDSYYKERIRREWGV